MSYINVRIRGIPYGRSKTRGNLAAPKQWSAAVIKQTRNLPPVKHACILRVTFLLPPNKFPSDLPFGPDLDNLLKRFMDALNQTIFRSALGKDSCVVSLSALKTKAAAVEDAGVQLEILPVSIQL